MKLVIASVSVSPPSRRPGITYVINGTRQLVAIHRGSKGMTIEIQAAMYVDGDVEIVVRPARAVANLRTKIVEL